MKLTKPIQKVLALAGLAAALLAAASPAWAEPDGYYNDAQLKLLFSGAKVEATGEIVCRSYPAVGDVTLIFDFAADGSLTVDYECSTTFFTSVYDVGSDTGNWRVEDNELCLEVSESATRSYFPSHKTCWPVKHGKYQFGLYAGNVAFWNLSISHPQFPTKEKIMAALEKLAAGTEAVASAKPAKIKTMARPVTLPPAPYKALPKGTRIKYDDRIYRVTRTDGFLTIYRSVTGDKLSYLNAYALFGEFADNFYVTADFAVNLEINSENRKKLEGFWPLEVGKKIRFILNEGAGSGAFDPDEWEITLEVSKAEAINLNGKYYKTYVIEEEGRSGTGKFYVGRKWYNPSSGLIIKATRTWKKTFDISGGGGYVKSTNFAQGEVDNYSLVRVRFPKGATAVAETPASALPPAATESAPKVNTAELARLEREAEEKRLAAARKAEVEQKARQVEVARLAIEAEKAREDEEKAGTAAQKEIVRLKREAVEAQKEIAAARLREAEKARAREAEFALLRQQLEEALKARKTAEAPKAKPKPADGLAGIEFGNYNALVIGINNYQNLPKLTTAITDAKSVSKILKEEYGFKVTTLIDPDRLDIIDAFDELKDALTDEDNLLIYYAGHGWLDQDTDRGYWLPVDAKPGRRSRWVSNATITDTLKGLSAKHVMVVADSCYSGTLTRAADVGSRKRTKDYWKKMASKWARVAITSGGLEPVADKGGGKNSPFAKAFIDVLRDNGTIMDGMQLFNKMRRPVMVATEQTPQYADVRNAGHDGGDFLFVRKK